MLEFKLFFKTLNFFSLTSNIARSQNMLCYLLCTKVHAVVLQYLPAVPCTHIGSRNISDGNKGINYYRRDFGFPPLCK